jgi:tetrahydromethanopterin S-methyltransferase subunit G
LRKVRDVQDELNLITGELTQRIGKMVIDGRGEVETEAVE